MLRSGIGGSDDVQISPIDAEIVAGLFEDGLLLGAHTQHLQFSDVISRPGDRLMHVVDGDICGSVEVSLNAMRAAIGGLYAPGQVGHGPRQHIQIAGESRREKCYRNSDVSAFKPIDSVGRQHVEMGLSKGRQLTRLRPNQAINFIVNSNETAEGLYGAGPVFGWLIGQAVRHGPDAEVRIMRDKRDCRRPEICA